MRTIGAALTAEQKQDLLTPVYKVVLTAPASGGSNVTYEQGRILSIDHNEAPYSQTADIVLDNFDQAITATLLGFTGVISYGTEPPFSSNTSPAAPLYVTEQHFHSSEDVLAVVLRLEGDVDFMAHDRASADFEQEIADLKTLKDLITEVLKCVLPDWVADTVYNLGDLVIPTAQDGFIYKATAVAGDQKSHVDTEPTWANITGGYGTSSIGGTIVDDQVTWTRQGKELAVFSHVQSGRRYTPTFDSEDNELDSYNPADAFLINFNDSRLAILQQLMMFTKCQFRFEDDGNPHIFVPHHEGPDWKASTAYNLKDYVRDPAASPANNFAFECTAAGTSHSSAPVWPTTADGAVIETGGVEWTARAYDYEYKLGKGNHSFISASIAEKLTKPNYVKIESHPDSDDNGGAGFSGSAEDTDSSNITDMELRDHKRTGLGSNAEGRRLAEAQLQSIVQKQQAPMVGDLPLNVAQEVHDWVKLTDDRRGGSVAFGNVGAIQRMVGPGRWRMNLSLGDIRKSGFVGARPPYFLPDPIFLKPGDSDLMLERTIPDPAARDVFEEISNRLVRLEQSLSPSGMPSGWTNHVARVDSHEQDIEILNDLVRRMGVFLKGVRVITVTDETYTVKHEDDVILVDRAGTVTLTVPTAAIKAGDESNRFAILIIDISGAAFTNNITIATEGDEETIDDAATLVMDVNYQHVGLVADGSHLWTA